jgi:hypothetical protein
MEREETAGEARPRQRIYRPGPGGRFARPTNRPVPATLYIDPFTVANTVNNTDSSRTNGSTANIQQTYI